MTNVKLATLDNTGNVPLSQLGNAPGGSVNLASLAAAQPCIVDLPENHGAKRDGTVLTDVTVNGSTGVLTSPSATFKAGDVGKTIIVVNPGSGVSMVVTIAGFNDAHNVVLSANNGTWGTTSACYGTDDGAAIRAAVANAVSVAQSTGQNYAEVWFSAGVYFLSGATQPNGNSSYGNAQIPLPAISQLGRKVTLVLRGVDDAITDPHWLTTKPQVSGAVLFSTVTSTASDPTYGGPAVIGGMTPQGQAVAPSSDFSGGFSNMFLVIDGLNIVCPLPGAIGGVDVRKLCGARVKTLSCMPFCNTVSQMSSNISSSGVNVGYYGPANQNNDYNEVDELTVFGHAYGVGVDEHFNARRLALIYCGVGIYVDGTNTGALQEAARISYASIEGGGTAIQGGGSGTKVFPLQIDLIGCEAQTGTFDIDDQSNGLLGYIGWAENTARAPKVRGAASTRIINWNQPPGHVAAPSVPATTVALQNPFWRDAAVTITGGTVTAIAVDGTATGLTSGTVIVPSGKTITLTYSAAPSWNWVLL